MLPGHRMGRVGFNRSIGYRYSVTSPSTPVRSRPPNSRSVRPCVRDALLLAAVLLSGLPAHAHDSGAAYLRLEVTEQRVLGEIDLALADALALAELSIDLSAEDAWKQLPPRKAALAARVARDLVVENSGRRCPLELSDPLLHRTEEAGLVRVIFVAQCGSPIEQLVLRYSLVRDLDPKHRAFVALKHESRLHSIVLSENEESASFDLKPPPAWQHFRTFCQEGVHHIQTGYDHLLFLVALLLPAGMRRDEAGGWVARESVRDVLVEVATVVTAFTLAHSLTLGLASLDIARLPSRGVEVAIAFSVLIAALNNIGSFMHVRAWHLACGFGLIHGFGFAAQLGVLGLPTAAKAVALLGFNLGVEVGQLWVAAACLVPLLALRRRPHHRRGVEVASALVAWLASIWIVERLFGVTLLGL